MRLGRAAAYAIFAVVYIARSGKKGPVQGKDIAGSCDMPPGRLLKILQQLVRARILASERGPAGGFQLRRPPSEISVLDIVETVEGPIDGDLLAGNGVANMERARTKVGAVCSQVAHFARESLGALTVTDLAS
ncbi:MAG: Rrf2 family transcriptional regulator [Phycisphaerae bacterium]|jgi:Rrf2 family protein